MVGLVKGPPCFGLDGPWSITDMGRLVWALDEAKGKAAAPQATVDRLSDAIEVLIKRAARRKGGERTRGESGATQAGGGVPKSFRHPLVSWKDRHPGSSGTGPAPGPAASLWSRGRPILARPRHSRP